jgi:transketolase C-terminal domain/subunit
MRRCFGDIIAEIARADPRVHLIIGDTSYKIFSKFLKTFPLQERFIDNRLHNFGTAEQSMVNIATGMALEGRIQPWVYALTPFLLERACEQVKLTGLQRANVKLVGYCDYPDEGPTHALMDERFPEVFRNVGIRTYYPRNSEETIASVRSAHISDGPVIISLKSDPKYLK